MQPGNSEYAGESRFFIHMWPTTMASESQEVPTQSTTAQIGNTTPSTPAFSGFGESHLGVPHQPSTDLPASHPSLISMTRNRDGGASNLQSSAQGSKSLLPESTEHVEKEAHSHRSSPLINRYQNVVARPEFAHLSPEELRLIDCHDFKPSAPPTKHVHFATSVLSPPFAQGHTQPVTAEQPLRTEATSRSVAGPFLHPASRQSTNLLASIQQTVTNQQNVFGTALPVGPKKSPVNYLNNPLALFSSTQSSAGQNQSSVSLGFGRDEAGTSLFVRNPSSVKPNQSLAGQNSGQAGADSTGTSLFSHNQPSLPNSRRAERPPIFDGEPSQWTSYTSFASQGFIHAEGVFSCNNTPFPHFGTRGKTEMVKFTLWDASIKSDAIYMVHKYLLDIWPCFKDLKIGDGSNESITIIEKVTDIDPSDFSVFVTWLYTGQLRSCHDRYHGPSSITPYELINVYIFAVHQKITALQDNVMSILVAHYNELSERIRTTHVAVIFQVLPWDSALSRFIVDTWSQRASHSDITSITRTKDFPHQDLVEFMNRAWSATAQLRSDGTTCSKLHTCDYHEHPMPSSTVFPGFPQK